MPRTKKAQGDEPLPPLDVVMDAAPVLSTQHNYYHDFYVALKLQFYPGTEEPVHHAIDGTAVSASDYHKNDASVTNPV